MLAAPGLVPGRLLGAQESAAASGGVVQWHDPVPAIGLLVLAILLTWSLQGRRTRAAQLREVAESEARLTAVIESALDAIVVVDERFRITFVNAAAEQIFACRAADAMGRPLADFVPERFREKQEREYQTFAASDAPSARFGGHRARFGLRGNGEEFPFDGSMSRTRIRGQTFYTLIIRDTSESVRAAAALERSVSLLRSTLESTADGILVVDRQGRVASYNGTFLEMWRIPAELVQSGDDNQVLPLAVQQVADPEGFSRRVAELYADWEAESLDVIQLRDGRVFERLSRPQRLDGGEVIGRVWSFRDVTERAGAERMIRRSEASFRSFVENSPYGIFRSTMDGDFLAVNPALVAMLGYDSEAELKGLNIQRHVYRDSAERERVVRRFAGRPSTDPIEVEWRRKDGTPLTVRLWAKSVRDAAGAVQHYEGFVADVTPLRAAEQALRQAEKLAALGQLVSGVAHELNNPLTAILHFADDMLTDPRPPRDLDALTIIRQQATRSRAIVRDLSSFARSRRAPLAVASLRDVIAGAARALEPQVRELGATLTLELDAELGAGEVDAAGIEQVIANLIVNAAQAAGAGGSVRLAASREATACCRVVIEDDGPGIPDAILPRIFEPFFTTKPAGVGTGLGLSVSLGIVEQHHGTLTAENRRAPERGARFTLMLPTTGDSASAGSPTLVRDAATPPPPAARRGGARRVLIVDDEAPIREALKRFFVRAGWEVSEASNGAAALSVIERSPKGAGDFSLIISDLRMPGVSGIALHDWIAASRPELVRRFVVSTGDVASPEAAAFVARVHCPVLEKPFDFVALDAIIRDAAA
ncbi:MAG TPA: PAS domain S-box protein [Gemmatimonadaceae bacterium]|nr:PAS domain S-box protein [Gemmatimonadaceae bacterium]